MLSNMALAKIGIMSLAPYGALEMPHIRPYSGDLFMGLASPDGKRLVPSRKALRLGSAYYFLLIVSH